MQDPTEAMERTPGDNGAGLCQSAESTSCYRLPEISLPTFV
jgi:hypothetical protein